MVIGALQLTGKAEQLAEKKARAWFGRLVPHLHEGSSDGFFQVAGTKQIAGSHGGRSSSLEMRAVASPTRALAGSGPQSGRLAASSVLSFRLMNI